MSCKSSKLERWRRQIHATLVNAIDQNWRGRGRRIDERRRRGHPERDELDDD